jgi:hypothetical protein
MPARTEIAPRRLTSGRARRHDGTCRRIEGEAVVENWIARAALASALGAFVWAMAAANLGEVGVIAGGVFGLGAAYLAYEYLTRRAEEKLTRDKWKDYE